MKNSCFSLNFDFYFKNSYIYIVFLFILGDAWILLNMLYDINFTLCPFRLLTKLPCPFCGTTRALMYILKGNFLAAFLINPLSMITIPFLSLIKILLLIDLFLRKSLFIKFINKLEFYIKYIYLRKKVWFLFIFMVVFLNWIFLIITHKNG